MATKAEQEWAYTAFETLESDASQWGMVSWPGLRFWLACYTGNEEEWRHIVWSEISERWRLLGGLTLLRQRHEFLFLNLLSISLQKKNFHVQKNCSRWCVSALHRHHWNILPHLYRQCAWAAHEQMNFWLHHAFASEQNMHALDVCQVPLRDVIHYGLQHKKGWMITRGLPLLTHDELTEVWDRFPSSHGLPWLKHWKMSCQQHRILQDAWIPPAFTSVKIRM